MPSIDYQTGLIAGLMAKGVVDGVAGEIEITENGEYDVTSYATATVNVAGGENEPYIQSSGAQYIDTGYYCNQDTKIEIKYELLSTSGNTLAVLGDEQNVLFMCKFNSGSLPLQWAWRFGNVQTLPQDNTNLNNGTVKVNIDGGDFSAYNGIATTTATVTPPATFTSTYSLLLFTSRDYQNLTNPNTNEFVVARMYYFKIFENNALVHNFVPHIDTNNVVCMLDTVTNTIHYNLGSGNFGYGVFLSN